MGIRERGWGSDLLDLAEGELEGGIDPAEDLPPPHEVRAVHDPDVRRRHLPPPLPRSLLSRPRSGELVAVVVVDWSAMKQLFENASRETGESKAKNAETARTQS